MNLWINNVFARIAELKVPFIEANNVFGKSALAKYRKSNEYITQRNDLRTKFKDINKQSILQIFETIQNLEENTELLRIAKLELSEKVINILEKHKNRIKLMLNSVEKKLYLHKKFTEPLKKLGIKIYISRETTFNSLSPGLELVEGVLSNQDFANLGDTRKPHYKVTIVIKLKFITMQESNNKQWTLPYFNQFRIAFRYAPVNTLNFLIHYIDDISGFLKNRKLFYKKYFKQNAFSRGGNISISSSMEYYEHPFVTAQEHACKGFYQKILETTYWTLDLNKIALQLRLWLTTYISDQTGPLKPISQIYKYGINEQWGPGTLYFTDHGRIENRSNNYFNRCWKSYACKAHCDAMNCVYRKNHKSLKCPHYANKPADRVLKPVSRKAEIRRLAYKHSNLIGVIGMLYEDGRQLIITRLLKNDPFWTRTEVLNMPYAEISPWETQQLRRYYVLKAEERKDNEQNK